MCFQYTVNDSPPVNVLVNINLVLILPLSAVSTATCAVVFCTLETTDTHLRKNFIQVYHVEGAKRILINPGPKILYPIVSQNWTFV